MKEVCQIQWLETVDSTNNEVLRRLESLDNLSVVAARCQTAGRGQRGNTWTSAPGENLTFSLLLKFSPGELPAGEAFSLTTMITSALGEFLLSKGVTSRVKWPNDIYVRDKKISGILIESGLEGGCVAWSVVGVGLNLNQTDFPPGLVNPTSLAAVTGEKYDPAACLEQLMALTGPLTLALRSREGRASLEREYLPRLYRKDVFCEYADGESGERFTAALRGVTSGGKAVMEYTDGSRKEFSFKEIAYII